MVNRAYEMMTHVERLAYKEGYKQALEDFTNSKPVAVTEEEEEAFKELEKKLGTVFN